MTAVTVAGLLGVPSSASSDVVAGSAEPPPAPPVATCRGTASVTVDDDRRIAHDRYVVLHVRAPEGAQEVEISNDGFRHSDLKPLVASCRYEWTLDGPSARRAKVVSVRFPGVAGVLRDAIVLDDAGPVIRRVSARWVNRRQGWVLHVAARDRGTGIAEILVGKTRATARTWRWPADIVSWDSTQLRWVRVVDGAGLASDWYHLRL